jgi:hypothetical protein
MKNYSSFEDKSFAFTARRKSIISFGGHSSGMAASEEVVSCENCGNPIDACMCACPFCGQIDACECCLHDAATGG